MNVHKQAGQVGDTGTSDGVVEQLQQQLEEARAVNSSLSAQLNVATDTAASLRSSLNQVLASSSWRITAPLRRFRTLMGAPAPLFDAPLLPGEPHDSPSPPEPWDSLIPESTSPAIITASARKAVRNNETCRIVSPGQFLEGLLPDRLVQGDEGDELPSELYYGDRPTPPRLAFLGSEELASELAHDAHVTRLRQESWRSQLDGGTFELVLVEPVWHVGNREWRNSLLSGGRGRDEVERLLERSRELGLPRALWFRGTVTAANHFAWLLDYIDAAYAVDEPAAKALQAGHARPVHVLPAAVQPAIHNPFRTWEQLEESAWRDRVLFDGWLDLQEGADGEALLQELKSSRLLVAESEWQFGGLRLADSPEYMSNALGCLDTAGKIAISKMVGLEVFRDSPLVPSWRRRTMMLRSMACGSPVADLSGDSWQVSGLPLRGSHEALGARIVDLLDDPLARDRTRHRALREILGNHCLADRLNRIAADLRLSVQFGRRPANVACLLVTMRPQLLEDCVERFRADIYPHKELVVVLHGHEASLKDARRLVREGEAITIYQLGRELSLGACLNFAASQTDAEYWAKFDDDDIYGPNYLSDIMMYRRAYDFPVAAKTAAFTYHQADDEVRWDRACAERRSLQYRRPGCGEKIHVAGGTLVGKRSVLENVPFSVERRRGSDSDFLRRSDAAGYPFVSLDYFNFALFRSGEAGFHTWNADDERMKQRTQSIATGPGARDVVFV